MLTNLLKDLLQGGSDANGLPRIELGEMMLCMDVVT